MITIIKTYQIKTSCKGEVISNANVVDLPRSISDSLAAIYDNAIPISYAQQIITIFTTTNIPVFNDLFDKLCTNLISMKLQASINMSMLSTGINLENNMRVVDYVLKYAQTVYSDCTQKEMWDTCINATPVQSGLLSITDTVAVDYTCFNCGKKGHQKKENWPEPVNKEQQKLEREKFNLEKGRGRQ